MADDSEDKSAPITHHIPVPADRPQYVAGRRHRAVNPGDGWSGAGPVSATPDLPDSPPPAIAPQSVETIIPARIDTFVPLSDTPLDVVYGPFWKGGQVFHEKTYPDGVTVIAWAICWGPINSIDTIQIDGQPFGSFPGSAFNIHLTNDVNDTILNQYVPGIGKPADTIAHVVASFPANTSVPNPHSALFGGTGLLVCDPELDPTLATKYYRPYPPVCLADYLASTKYGEGQPTSAVYGSASLVTANQDSYFNIGGGTPRYICSVILNSKRDPQSNKELIRTCGALNYNYNSGVFNYWVDKAQSLSGITLTDVGSAANIVSAGPLVVNGKADCPSQVLVHFVNAAASYKDDFAVYPPTASIPAGVELIRKEYYLGQVSFDQAYRIARYLYRRLNMDKSARVRALPDGGEQILPGIVVSVTAQQLAWSNQAAIVTDWIASPDEQNQFLWEGRLELYDAAVYDDTAGSGTAYAPPSNPSPWIAPPDVVNVAFGNNDSDGYWSIYWDWPATITENLYGGSNWSQTNCGGFVAANVNNANTVVKAFDWNVAADSTLTFDAGVGVSKAFRRVALWIGTSGILPVVEYSDNGSSWTPVTMKIFNLVYPADVGSTSTIGWEPAGAHRYWRLRKGSTFAFTSDFYEVQWGEVGQSNPFVTDFFVYGPSGNLFATYSGGSIPTRTAPLSLRGLMQITGSLSSGTVTKTVTAKVVAAVGKLTSAGVTVTQNLVVSAASLTSETLSLSSLGGLLSDVDLSGLAAPQANVVGYITGPLGGFSLGGFKPVYSGKTCTLYNSTGSTMSVTENDTSTPAGRRIKTFVGNVTANNFVDLVYSSQLAAWILRSHG